MRKEKNERGEIERKGAEGGGEEGGKRGKGGGAKIKNLRKQERRLNSIKWERGNTS
jgi:hypothetical protein